MAAIERYLRKIAIICVKLYAYLLSPWFGWHCRFTPTCSQYAIESLNRHGLLKGLWFTVSRLCRCHPWHVGGDDPVKPVKIKIS